MFIFAPVVCVFNTLGTVVGEFCPYFNFGSEAASLFGALFIISGIIGCGVFGAFIEIK